MPCWGEKSSALKEAERAIMLVPGKDAMSESPLKETLALIQTMCGENSRAISGLTELYKRPMVATVTALPLRRLLLGLIRSGTLCAPILLSKNSARKSSREPARFRSAIDSSGRTIGIADAHRDDGKRFVIRADEKLTAFMELESAVRTLAAGVTCCCAQRW